MLPHVFYEISNLLLDARLRRLLLIEVLQDLEELVKVLFIADRLVKSLNMLHILHQVAENIRKHGDS